MSGVRFFVCLFDLLCIHVVVCVFVCLFVQLCVCVCVRVSWFVCLLICVFMRVVDLSFWLVVLLSV